MSVVAPQFGFAVTFLIPALLLAGCTVGVWLIRDQCVHVPPAGSIVGKAWTVVWDALHARLRRPQAPARHWLDRAIPVHGQEVVAEVRPILRVMKVRPSPSTCTKGLSSEPLSNTSPHLPTPTQSHTSTAYNARTTLRSTCSGRVKGQSEDW